MLIPMAKTRFRQKYDKVSSEHKWILRTNADDGKVYVEDLMYELGDAYDYEHTVHS
ncbi:hypothetical protein LRAMOSA06072 [Lichtheimia ramosa]|uniref:Uncharacterized protein n=1 Tax=Lichtheimia ramosa TaxID=688394 RepID=A0A077X352_9FUNG|nr:hypothetical protein LRAMOSA06072 [Lichtheimia ramosa]